jgi:tripartite-type tricarboxylate transporter receptor subunit TctC
MKKMIAHWMAACTLLVLACTSALAQPYPNRPVKMVVGFVPGGAPDFVARALSAKLTETLGQAFVVDNKPGVGGSLSTSLVAKSPPDGYTLLLADTATLMLAPHLFKGVPADTMKDFVPVGMVTTEPLLIVANAKTGLKTLPDLIKQVKANPGRVSYGSSGVGSIHHIGMEVFKAGAGLFMVHIPYKGSGQSILAVISGEVPVTITSFAAAAPHIQSGAITLLAVTSRERLAAFPNVPSLSEIVKDYDYPASFGVIAPLGTPKEVISRLSAAMKQATESADFVGKFKGQHTVIKWTSPDQYNQYLLDNQRKFARAAKLVNLQPN